MQSNYFAFPATIGLMRGTDVQKRLRDSGKKQTALAIAMDRSVHAISRLVNSHKELTPSEIAVIEEFFGDRPAPALPTTMRVPVYGYASAFDGSRVALGSDHVLDYIELPVGLVRGDVIAIRIVGDSMEPRLFSGETVLVALNVSPTRNGDCVVEMKDGSAMVKQYRGSRDGVVFLHQYNPDEEVRIPQDKVRAIHAVIMRR